MAARRGDHRRPGRSLSGLYIQHLGASASTVAFVTGLGCALVFPALGVEALKRVLPANRGSAMGAFVAFLDIAYGISGPAAGIIAGQFCFAAVYLLGAACALLGGALVATAQNPQS